ncbi:hypothetical protein GOP47_0008328 [Adiantum capillus-veneris]|uniref:Uncharacterized protein n=1 Tax=Adiantum capillus-veneris TaxID=13818 RepID=A0A9D4UZ44_ADICA|nr:hypothetical protein GOP47_0008328 [Adiantum capillus-veneris]
MGETASELRDRILLKNSQNSIASRYGATEEAHLRTSPPVGCVERDVDSIPLKSKVMPIDTENIHDGLGFAEYMLAGSIAGMVEHTAMFPVDTLKTRMQMARDARGSVNSSLVKTFSSIIRVEGPAGLYRGIGAMALGAGPAHAVYFSVYELCKERFGGNEKGHHPLAHGTAGIVATVASDAVFTPMDVVKQRLQLPGKSYKGVVDCIQRILQTEGPKAFYASYRTTVVMNAPYTATHFATYEAIKASLKEIWPERTKEENLFVHLTAGGAAGALASIITTPLDVVKTRLQCQGVNGAERYGTNSIWEVIRSITKNEGARALLREGTWTLVRCYDLLRPKRPPFVVYVELVGHRD